MILMQSTNYKLSYLVIIGAKFMHKHINLQKKNIKYKKISDLNGHVWCGKF